MIGAHARHWLCVALKSLHKSAPLCEGQSTRQIILIISFLRLLRIHSSNTWLYHDGLSSPYETAAAGLIFPICIEALFSA